MASGGEKNWSRPWSMEEMIENAENWSLAGDVALLNTLKAFSENLFSKTLLISNNVNNLLHSLDEVNLKLNLSQNEFQSLRNTQFIESRVYEDDETLDFKEEAQPEQKAPSDEEKEKLMRESVLEGLRVVDKYFERVEVSISDSEDEESDKSYILRPKDIYADRPLPLVIGTEEWYKKWHVGLADSSSESESEKVSETYSDSESGDDLPKDLMKGSETSSELDFSSRTSDNRPAANSTFNESARKPNVFASDEESDGQGSVPVKTPISSKSFAEQLAAKLGDVISEREDISTEINRKPIQPAQNKFAGDLFSDEPPPLDDLEDTILPKSAHEGLFSGGRGLFDDNEDDLFWGQQSKGPSGKPSDGAEGVKKETERSSEKVVSSVDPPPRSSQVTKGPFDTDEDSSDEDIFSTKKKPVARQPFLQPYATTAPLFDEEPPELEKPKKPIEEKKKPIGGVSIFGKSDIFSGEKVGNILKSRQQDPGNSGNVDGKVTRPTVKSEKNSEEVKPKLPNLFDEDEDKEPATVPTLANPKPQKISLFDDEEEAKPDPASKPKKISLFDDDDDLFKDDLFSGITAKKLTSNLFDDVGESSENLFAANVNKNDTPKADLFSDLAGIEDVDKNVTEQKPEAKPKKTLDLFAAEEDLFGIIPKPVENVDKTVTEQENDLKPKKTLDLFSAKEEDLFGIKPSSSEQLLRDNTEIDDITKETEGSKRTVGINDEVDKGATKTVENLPQRQVIGAEKLSSSEQKTTKGLFDESLEKDDSEDLFKQVNVKKEQEKTDLFEDQTSEIAKNTAQNQKNVKSDPKEAPQSQMVNSEPGTSNVVEKSETRTTINLFGSSPPPDDDDWDTKSVPSSDNEDQFSFRIDYNTAGSSLFDNEPPSLGPNESSGIVRDENVTRVDTDESFFNPYASSSRRLSSDVFSDQQSQDSFFVTKNKTESVSVVPPLDKIPEVSKFSNLDITPSGNLEDLEDSKGDSSVFQDSPQHSQIATSDPKKPVSLFDDEFDNSADADGLFSSISKSSNAPKLSEKRLSLFDNMDDVLEVNHKSKNPVQVENKEEAKDSTKAEELVTETEQKSMSAEAVSGEKKVKKPPTGSPGKLKHNLKINVNALMPGAAPPRLREMMKSHSLDLPKDQTTTPTQPLSPDVGLFMPTVSIPRRDGSSTSSEKAVSFEDALDNIEVLHSVTKDRAKIPIKRRPSTRRGRKQAIQTASSEPAVVKGDDDADVVTESTKFEPVVVEPVTYQESPPSLFHTPPSSEAVQTAQTPPSDVKQSRVASILDDIGNDASDLFPASTEKVTEEKSKGSIFESEDSDGELFGHTGANRAKKEGAHKKVDGGKKKPLFNDSSSDEDLFSGAGGGGSKRKENVQKVIEKKPQKPPTTRKLENIETNEDPLSSLLK
ncbi:WASH complex subunit 2 [Anoplophora glabripennis]|uniref:WASH complex subunit 2 n=1 Tax=Anoplophora glabripennis TaxID=217634 RepID=UPI000875434E|nr:WASH complex subunit 2 [Anoplophora glabripennis]